MQEQIYKLEEDLKRRNVSSSHLVAERIINLFTRYVTSVMED
jgi:hypothetical protein